jgi:hypothetical protein
MHSCPECGSACHCGGDIDDIDTGDTEAEDNCICCAEGDSDEGYFDDDFDTDDEDDDAEPDDSLPVGIYAN